MTADDKISRFTAVAGDLDSVKQQLVDHKAFQEEVSQQQDVFSSLANMVVIIDDTDNGNNPANSEALSDYLEGQLVALDEKWTHVCRFVEERGRILQEVIAAWESIEEDEFKFNAWLAKLDKRLTQMEDAADETLPGSPFTLELVKRLQKMEKEMEMQHNYFSKIADDGQSLLEKLDKGSPASVEIARKLQNLSESWESTIQRMDNLGLEITKLSDLQTPVERPIRLSPAERHDLNSETLPDSTENASKKRKLDSWRVQEWKRELDTITGWLERVEQSIGIDDESEGSLLWEELALEEKQVLLEDTENDVDLRRHEFEKLIEQGKQITDELKQSEFAVLLLN
ncbi:dystrophin-like protein [Leptotrombidium deliense]|uniref:Dystrophin-like protein n=1 Tax=Leptotrombidium deliense TaxID=299467 RepID=A0A443S4W5_9ACAR|nr:dystrophin-like protein [Leptotrombidium deliense]